MKGLQKLCLVALLGMTVAGCSSDPKEDEGTDLAVQVSRADAEGYFEFIGHVVYNSFEGGFYGLTAGDKKYDPLQLPREFQSDGMKVRVRARTRDWVSGRNWGRMIHVVEIEPCCQPKADDEDD